MPEGQALPQQQNAEGHADQRVDEIAHAAFYQVSLDHRPDEHGPVDAHQHRGEDQEQRGFAVGQGIPDLAPAAAQGDQRGQQHAGPEDAVGRDLQGGHVVDQLPIRRDHAPQEEGSRGVQDARSEWVCFLLHGCCNIGSFSGSGNRKRKGVLYRKSDI